MVAKATKEKRLQEILEALSAMKGTKHAFYLTRTMRTGLKKLESDYPSLGPLTIKNEGVMETLKREHVACILKDRNFRAPPHATVLLIDDDGNVLGRELLPGEKLPKGTADKAIMVGKDFVVFYRKGAGKGARFILPPVPFAEVERISGTRHTVSSSPSTAGDFFLRRKARLDDDPKLASILIGFDLVGAD
jgi:hypothetical protein